MAKPIINLDKCSGCGTCAALCPSTFEIQNDNKSHVINENGCQEDCDCQAVVESCPEGAISLE